VVFFRDQDLPPAKFLAFAKRFGEVVEYPFIKGNKMLSLPILATALYQ
jgi:alpha-ketoglutarate-dependent taurine dioxygenase